MASARIGVASAFLLAALSGPGLAEPIPVRTDFNASITSGRAAELERLVRHDCGSCHGMTLKGGLGPDIRRERFDKVPPEAIAQVILDGKPGTPMPPWRPLISESEALWIASYLIKGERP